jgi:hypothetical protein
MGGIKTCKETDFIFSFINEGNQYQSQSTVASLEEIIDKELDEEMFSDHGNKKPSLKKKFSDLEDNEGFAQLVYGLKFLLIVRKMKTFDLETKVPQSDVKKLVTNNGIGFSNKEDCRIF